MDFSEIAREMRLRSMIEFYKTLDPHTEYARGLRERIKAVVNRG